MIFFTAGFFFNFPSVHTEAEQVDPQRGNTSWSHSEHVGVGGCGVGFRIALTWWARLCTGAGLAGYCPPVVSGWQLAWTCSPTPACSPLSHLCHTKDTWHSVMMTWSYVMRLLFDRSFQKELSVLTHFVTFWYQNSHSLKSEGPAEQICKDRWLRPSLPCFLIRLGWLVKTATRMCSYL